VSFSFAVSFPQEISRQDRLATTIGNSIDLRHARFWSSSEDTSFFQSRLLLAADHLPAPTGGASEVRTGLGNSWNMMRVRSARSYYQLPAFREDDDHANEAKEVTVKVAAQRLNVSQWMVRRMIEEKILPARQVVVCAPWQIPVEALD
jgi:hypothetical protein